MIGVTAAQSGKTENLLDVIGQRLDERPVPTLYVGPTRDFLVDRFEPRLTDLFDQAPTLRDKIVRGRRMKKLTKWVSGVQVRLAYAGSAQALKSDPIGLALVDEYDGMLAVQKSGDPLVLVEARGATYADFTVGVVSTPSRGTVDVVKEASGLEFWRRVEPQDLDSKIWVLFQEGTMHHWAWPCPHCDEFFIPRFRNLHWPEEATAIEAGRNAWLECPRCQGTIIDDIKPAMNSRGLFVAPGQSIDKDGVITGAAPESLTISFWVSGLASPFVTFGARAEAYVLAEDTGDPGMIQAAINSGFGELYAPGGGVVPEWQEVAALRIPYERNSVPVGVVFLVASVDVQKNRLVYDARLPNGKMPRDPRRLSWLAFPRSALRIRGCGRCRRGPPDRKIPRSSACRESPRRVLSRRAHGP